MILPIAVSLLAVTAFALVLWRTDIAGVARQTVERSSAGVGAMLDPQLDDDAKEAALRAAGLRLLASAGGIAWRFALALAALAAPLLLADAAGLAASGAVLDLMLRVDYLVIVSLLAVGMVAVLRRVRPAAKPAPLATGHTHYRGPDRVFHYLAFASPAVLKTASRLEDRVLPDVATAPGGPPIFVTSLARAGTTALLNALSAVPGIATHTYRDMPFLTAPVLWNRLTGGASRAVAQRQRAHGDGLQIDLDSPEAFEEVLWKMFWPGKFAGARIDLWRADEADHRAERFMTRHMAKIIAARAAGRAGGAGVPARYCSKNNANIARLEYLARAFPGCRIVVPVRRPESHAASLLRQHRNFVALQREDEFVRRYMGDIGHFEFGLIHKPIGFAGFEPDRYERDSADYWLAYWLCANRAILSAAAEYVIVTQDDLRAAPQRTMAALCAAIEVDPGATDFSGYFREGPDTAPTQAYDPDLQAQARAVYADLCARALAHEVPNRRLA